MYDTTAINHTITFKFSLVIQSFLLFSILYALVATFFPVSAQVRCYASGSGISPEIGDFFASGCDAGSGCTGTTYYEYSFYVENDGISGALCDSTAAGADECYCVESACIDPITCAAPTPTPAGCPSMTCSYSQATTTGCASGFEEVTGNSRSGCTGFNTCSDCTYIGGCSTISCVPSSLTPTLPPGTPTPTLPPGTPTLAPGAPTPPPSGTGIFCTSGYELPASDSTDDASCVTDSVTPAFQYNQPIGCGISESVCIDGSGDYVTGPPQCDDEAITCAYCPAGVLKPTGDKICKGCNRSALILKKLCCDIGCDEEFPEGPVEADTTGDCQEGWCAAFGGFGGGPSTPDACADPDCTRVRSALGEINVGRIQDFISQLFSIILGIAGLIAFFLLVFAGYLLLTSGGDKQKVHHAREVVTSAIAGLLFIILSMIILEVIGVNILGIFRP